MLASGNVTPRLLGAEGSPCCCSFDGTSVESHPHDPIGASITYLTTAPVGSLLDGEAYYTTRFAFTSAATAAVAGICALIVSANPDLTSTQVKAVLRDSCEKIDLESGTYDEHGHSPLYGYGRPDVARAVNLARQHP